MDVVVRAFFAFLFVFIVTRLIGRREVGELEPFDLILLIVIGDLIQQGITQSDYSFTGLVLAGGMFALLTLGVSYLGFRVPRARRLIEPPPLILVEDGRVIERNLHRERMTLDELRAAARQQGIASLDGVEWAVLESNGRVSFLIKR